MWLGASQIGRSVGHWDVCAKPSMCNAKLNTQQNLMCRWSAPSCRGKNNEKQQKPCAVLLLAAAASRAALRTKTIHTHPCPFGTHVRHSRCACDATACACVCAFCECARLSASHTNAQLFFSSFSLRILFTFLKIEMFSSLPHADWSEIASFRVRIVRAYWTIGHESRCACARWIWRSFVYERVLHTIYRGARSSRRAFQYYIFNCWWLFVPLPRRISLFILLQRSAHSDLLFQVGVVRLHSAYLARERISMMRYPSSGPMLGRQRVSANIVAIE